MVKIGKVVRHASVPELPRGLDFVIHFSCLRIFIETASKRGIGAMVGDIRDPPVVQSHIVGVELKPGEMVTIEIGSPKK